MKKPQFNPYAGIAPALSNNQRQPIPNFRNQLRLPSSYIAAAGSVQNIFSPNGACTVQWIIVQTSAAATIQLTLNQEPFSIPLTVGPGAVLRFAGMLLANNETLSLSVSAASNISYEIVWLKEIKPEAIDSDTNVLFSGLIGPAAPFLVETMNLSTTGAGGVNGALQTTPAGYRGATIAVVCTAASGTSPTFQGILMAYWVTGKSYNYVQMGAAVAVAVGNTYMFGMYPTALSSWPGVAAVVAFNGPLPLNWFMNYRFTVASTTATFQMYVNYAP